MEAGDKVRLGHGVINLQTQLRILYREGDVGVVEKVVSNTHVMVKVKKKGSVKLAKAWLEVL